MFVTFASVRTFKHVQSHLFFSFHHGSVQQGAIGRSCVSHEDHTVQNVESKVCGGDFFVVGQTDVAFFERSCVRTADFDAPFPVDLEEVARNKVTL